jgi:hypothetical protein
MFAVDYSYTYDRQHVVAIPFRKEIESADVSKSMG